MLFGSEASTLHSPVPQVFKLRNAFVNKQNAQKTSKQTKTFCKRFTSGLLHLQLTEMVIDKKLMANCKNMKAAVSIRLCGKPEVLSCSQINISK